MSRLCGAIWIKPRATRLRTTVKTIEDIGPQVVDEVRRQLQVDDEWAVVEPRLLTWWGHRLRQRVGADESVRLGGFAIVRVWAETDLLVDVPSAARTAEAIAVLNSVAALNAYVWRPEERRVSLRCATCIYSEVRGWMTRMFCSAVAMQVAEAEARVELLQKLIGGRVNTCSHPVSGVRRQPDDMLNVLTTFTTPADSPSPFHGDEMLSLLATLKHKTLANGDESGVTVEFPFPGAIPPTVLVRFFADVPNKTYGAGALLRMRLPSLPSGTLTGAEIANILNVGEIGQMEAGYSFGAWCIDVESRKGAAYVTFLPAAAYMPGLLQSMAISFAAKARWAHLFLDLENNTSELGVWHKWQMKLLKSLVKSAKP